MIGLLNVIDIVVGLIAFHYDPDISQESMEYLQHAIICSLIVTLAEVTGTSEEKAFEFLKPASDQAEGQPSIRDNCQAIIEFRMGEKQHE